MDELREKAQVGINLIETGPNSKPINAAAFARSAKKLHGGTLSHATPEMARAIILKIPDEEVTEAATNYLELLENGGRKSESAYKKSFPLLAHIIKKLNWYSGHSKGKGNNEAIRLKYILLSIAAMRCPNNLELVEQFISEFTCILCISDREGFVENADDRKQAEVDPIILKLSAQQYLQLKHMQARTKKAVVLKRRLGISNIQKAFFNLDTPYAFVLPQKYGFPEVKEAKDTEVYDAEKPTIFMAGLGEDALSLAREIDKQGGANVIIPLTYQATSGDEESEDPIWNIRKGIVYKNGELFFVKFDQIITPEYKDENDVYKITKTRPVRSGNRFVEQVLDSKIYTGNALSLFKVRSTWREKDERFKGRDIIKTAFRRIRVLKNEELPDGEWEKKRFIYNALTEVATRSKNKKIAIKPDKTSGGFGVMLLSMEDLVDNNTKIIRKILQYMDQGHDMVIEPFIEPYPIEIGRERVDWNLRVLVTKNSDGMWTIEPGIIVRYGKISSVLNISKDAKVTPLDALREQLPNYENLILAIAERAFEATRAVEAYTLLSLVKGGEKIPDEPMQNDRYGWDMIVTTDDDGNFEPVIIEGNGIQSGGQWDLDNVLPPERQGEGCRNIAALMIKKAKDEQIKRKSSSVTELIPSRD